MKNKTKQKQDKKRMLKRKDYFEVYREPQYISLRSICSHIRVELHFTSLGQQNLCPKSNIWDGATRKGGKSSTAIYAYICSF